MLHIATLFVVSLLVLAAGFLSQAPRWLFGAGVVGAMLAIGLFVITCDKGIENPKWTDEKGVFEAQLLENPHLRGVATRALASAMLPSLSKMVTYAFSLMLFSNCATVAPAVILRIYALCSTVCTSEVILPG